MPTHMFALRTSLILGVLLFAGCGSDSSGGDAAAPGPGAGGSSGVGGESAAAGNGGSSAGMGGSSEAGGAGGETGGAGASSLGGAGGESAGGTAGASGGVGGANGGASGAGGGADDIAKFLGDWTADAGSAHSYTCPGKPDSMAGFTGALVTILALTPPDIRFGIPGNGCTFDLSVSGDTATILSGQGCAMANTPLGTAAEMRGMMVATTTDGVTLTYTSSSTFDNGCTDSVTASMTHKLRPFTDRDGPPGAARAPTIAPRLRDASRRPARAADAVIRSRSGESPAEVASLLLDIGFDHRPLTGEDARDALAAAREKELLGSDELLAEASKKAGDPASVVSRLTRAEAGARPHAPLARADDPLTPAAVGLQHPFANERHPAEARDNRRRCGTLGRARAGWC